MDHRKSRAQPEDRREARDVTTQQLTIGDVRLTRVCYADVNVPAETVGLTANEITNLDWASPVWAEGNQAKAAAAAWVIEHEGERIVVDPAQAADEILRNDNDAAAQQDAFARLLADAGFPRESFTRAIASHIEGVGMFGWRNDDGSWEPFFPNAPILVTQTELDDVDAGTQRPARPEVVAELRARGAFHAVGDTTELTSAITLVRDGGHCPGHLLVRIEANGEQAVMVGHLTVSPLLVATGPNTIENRDAPGAWETTVALRDSGAILIGPLWPTPGAGRWDGTRLVPVTDPQ
jgi:hypothetical protein